MKRSLVLATALAYSLNAHAELGYFVAPDAVIANHQEFWAGLELENCKPRTIVTSTDEYFCDVLWEQLPDGIASDATETLLGAPSIAEGNHEIRGRIVKFRVSDPTDPVAEQEIVHRFRSIRFDPDIKLKGLPLDPLRDNEVWLESGDDASTKCIFYGGLEVPTPPDKIEEGKAYCRIIWENIPPGFAQFRHANTNLLSGKLLNADTKQVLDTNFIFTVEVVVPYERQITSKRYSIDASVDVLDSPDVEWGANQPDSFFLIDGSESLELVTPIKIHYNHGEPMLLQLLTESGDVVSEQYLMPDKGRAVEVYSLPLQSLESLPKGVTTKAFIELAYADKNAKPARHAIKILRTSPLPTVSITNVTRTKTKLNVEYKLTSYDASGVYQAYITELNDIDLAFLHKRDGERMPSSSDVGKLGTVVLKNGDVGSIDVGLGELMHSRYAIKVVQLGMDDDKVIRIGQVLSQPLVVSRRAIADIPGAIADHVAPVGSWAVVPDAGNATWVVKGKSLAPAREPMHLNKVGKYGIKDEVGSILPISVYQIPSVRLTIPEAIRLNSSLAARVYVNGEEAQLSDYELNWYEDDEYWGESSVFPLDYADVGKKRIRVAVSSRKNPDSFYLKSTIKEATIHVRQEASDE